jgi:hypothetical protein
VSERVKLVLTERCGVGKQTRVRLKPVRVLLVGHMVGRHRCHTWPLEDWMTYTRQSLMLDTGCEG